jgi:hypothetical protein
MQRNFAPILMIQPQLRVIKYHIEAMASILDCHMDLLTSNKVHV